MQLIDIFLLERLFAQSINWISRSDLEVRDSKHVTVRFNTYQMYLHSSINLAMDVILP